MNAKVEVALLCDSVRREDNGKLIVIGIYSSGILIPSFPSINQFTLFSRVKIEGEGQHHLRIRVNIDGQVNHIIEGTVEVSGPLDEWVQIPVQPIQFSVPGTLSFEQELDGGEWSEFLSVNVNRQPEASPPPAGQSPSAPA